jgi:hypothetical protein
VFVGLSILCIISYHSVQGAASSLTYWYRPIVSLISPEENSYSFLLWPKMMTATSTEQRTDNSCAFLKRPPLRLRKVLDYVLVSFMSMFLFVGRRGDEIAYTERFRSSFIALISIFLRPITSAPTHRCLPWYLMFSQVSHTLSLFNGGYFRLARSRKAGADRTKNVKPAAGPEAAIRV